MDTPDDEIPEAPPDAPEMAPTGEPPPGIDMEDPEDVAALVALRDAGWGEGDGDDPHLPDGLLELHEAIEAADEGLL